ncbi:MAG TPA: tRNA (guanosine(37)-N1)-methyltransferase TrmD, partial [Halieaceae bacterium]|nr:tRNA (guanosine(37)-N1)-methyltransferase TrmD [Halieaceae bacterium]
MHIAVVTLFPGMFEAVTAYGVTGRAVAQGGLAVTTVDPRDFTCDRHRTVDDRPYGGGPGMLMKIDPLRQALRAAREQAAAAGTPPRVVYLSPQGRRLDHARVKALAAEPSL